MAKPYDPKDFYYRQAKKAGLRARSAFKIDEILRKHQLLEAGQAVLDLGAAPGGWSQYAAERIGKSGKIIALDILPLEAIPGVVFIEGDFREEAVLEQLRTALAGQLPDIVLSDMAPNTTGVNAVDQARSMYLAELAMDTARELLKPGGSFVVKLFQGPDFDAYVKTARSMFGKVTVRKPKASRDRSPEVYLVGRSARK